MGVLILGAGGHAQVVADILFLMQKTNANVNPIGYLDDNPTLVGKCLMGLPVLGEIARLSDIPHDGVVVAIGCNATRQRLFEAWKAEGECFIVARHPSAIVAPDVQIGPGSVICAGVVINPVSVIGANVILNTGCTVDHHNCIGDHVHIAPGVHLGGAVRVGDGALIGIGAVVIPQRLVGAGCTIGAGSVVTKNIPAQSTAVGVPARVVRRAGPRAPEVEGEA